jgi:hypothetical protein
MGIGSVSGVIEDAGILVELLMAAARKVRRLLYIIMLEIIKHFKYRLLFFVSYIILKTERD